MSRYSDADLISRQEAIDALNKKRIETMEKGQDVNLIWECIDAVAQVPTADVAPVVHGEWIPSRFKTLQEDGWCECSVCGVGNKLYDRGVRKSDVPHIDGKSYELKNIANYCPNCGADMRGGTE